MLALHLCRKHKIELREGITEVYEAFKKYEGAKV